MPTTLIVHIPLEGCRVLPRKSLIFGYDTMLHVFLQFEPEREALHCCPSRWGGWIDEKHVFHYLETYFWRRLPVGVPKRCAERIKDLTDFIVRTNVYPVAYGGFSDVWSCYLQPKQSPLKNPKKVC